MKSVLLAGIFAAWATGAVAHSPLSGTTPANEATIAVMPSEVVLDFKGDIRLTRLTMSHADQPSVDLDLSGFKGFISDYAIPVPSMGKGQYVIEWRGLGADGHALNGAFSFKVE